MTSTIGSAIAQRRAICKFWRVLKWGMPHRTCSSADIDGMWITTRRRRWI